MWLIVKYKTKEFKFFKYNLLKNIDEKTFFYYPKIQKYKISNKNKSSGSDKNILGNYIIIYSTKFSQKFNHLNEKRVNLTEAFQFHSLDSNQDQEQSTEINFKQMI